MERHSEESHAWTTAVSLAPNSGQHPRTGVLECAGTFYWDRAAGSLLWIRAAISTDRSCERDVILQSAVSDLFARRSWHRGTKRKSCTGTLDEDGLRRNALQAAQKLTARAIISQSPVVLGLGCRLSSSHWLLAEAVNVNLYRWLW